MRIELFEKGVFVGRLFIRAAARAALDLSQAVLHRFHVGKDKFEIDRLDIPHGIDGIFYVRDIGILETAYDVHDRVNLADMGEEFVPQPFAAGGAFDEPRDIDKFDDGGGHLFALVERGQLVQPFVGHRHDAHVGLDGAERIIGAFRARVRDCVEESGFSYVGKSYDTEFHDLSFP